LRDTSVEHLRLEADTVRLLRRLGLKRTGQLYDLPRQGLARRFREDARACARVRGPGRMQAAQAAVAAQDVLRRLDQALGRSPEPLEGLLEPPVLSVSKAWTDPLMTAVGIEAEARVLAGRLVERLDSAGLGARRVRLGLYRCDGTMAEQTVGTSSPSLDADHIFALLRERLDCVDVGFGVDALVMEAVLADPVDAEQQAFGGTVNDTVYAGQWRSGLARLADRLGNRLGREAVGRLVPVQSHIPERAQRWEPVEDVGVFALSPVSRRGGGASQAAAMGAGHLETAGPAVLSDAFDASDASDASGPSCDNTRWPMPAHVQLPRPCFMLPNPEPIMVLAQVPEGAPRRFTWRRVVHDVAEAHGPERITPEWWREIEARIRRDGGPPGEGEVQSGGCRAPSRPRDYYRVQVRCGASFWIYREGLFSGGFCGEGVHGEAVEDFSSRPRWFLQGIYG